MHSKHFVSPFCSFWREKYISWSSFEGDSSENKFYYIVLHCIKQSGRRNSRNVKDVKRYTGQYNLDTFLHLIRFQEIERNWLNFLE